MKAWEIVGYAYDAALHCPDCTGGLKVDSEGNEVAPIFACDVQEGDYCDDCLAQWIATTSPKQRKGGAPAYVYLTGECPGQKEG